jgi:alpha-galactosidase
MLENIQALDSVLPVPESDNAILHWAKGGLASFDDFAPQETIFTSSTKLHLQPGGGRSSSEVLPFFNLAGTGAGIIAAIGWSGEWAADFANDGQRAISMKAGLAHTHLSLHPGEEIRTPRMLLLFYQDDQWRGQNLFRQFILAHHRPHPNGQPLVAPITCGNWGGTRAEVHLDNIRQIAEQKLPLDFYWIDAEWHGHGGWAENVGNWTVKRDLYPQGFKPLSDALRQSGRELMLWFEPERIFKGTPWHQEHATWLLGPRDNNSLLDLGNPAARDFLINFISDRIDEFGLGCYRQDFNIEPLPFWQAADAPDRQGIAETRHIEGLYAFWDALLARHPGLIIDNCASGGRRLDLETLGRATPFWRTDGPRDPIAHQCHTYGLLAWVPLSATSEDRPGDDYEFRSSMCSSLCLNWWVSGDGPADKIPANFPWDWARHTLDQYRKLRPYYYGDYYPLTTYSQSRDVWMAYQLDRPGLGAGVIIALRRPESPYETSRFPLRGLDAAATYVLTNLDTGEHQRLSGLELAEKGAAVSISAQPGSAVVSYQRE